MSKIETNVFPIGNLEELNCEYVLYKISGLSPDLDDYQKNIQTLTRKLSKSTNSTCAPLITEKSLFIAQPDGNEPLPSSMELVRNIVKLELEPGLKQLKFSELNDETSELALRFLYWSLQSHFWNVPTLWQPSSGQPFYDKYADSQVRKKSRNVDLYRGFSARLILLPNGKIGICVDVSSKYVSRYSLPAKISEDDIGQYKGMNCLYEYGNRWYEIKIQGFNDLNTSELELPSGRTLYEEVHYRAGKYKSPLLRVLPKDCSVLIYYNKDGDPRNVPSGLCRPTYRTDSSQIREYHGMTIKPPHIRRREIEYVINKYFRDLEFNGNKIKLSAPISYPEMLFEIPDLEFGNNKILSVRNTKGSVKTTLDRFPSMKKYMFYSEEAGIYTKEMFDKQYFIIPKSILDTFGIHIVNDINLEVNRLFTNEENINYDPIIVPYDDSVQKSVVKLGREILKAVEENQIEYGYGVVMIPKIPSKRMIKEDELANLLMRELRKRDIYVSIMHTTVSSESYEYYEKKGEWQLIPEKKIISRYKGYIKNVALNKVLLLNEFWPFILKTPLNADLIIGIDVKNNTAGFTIIHKTGDLSFKYSTSEQREQLGRNHIREVIVNFIINEQKIKRRPIKNIMIHRQGTLFLSEKKGVKEAISILSKQGFVEKDYNCTFIEVRTTSRISFRMFKVSERPGRQEDWVENPTISTHIIISADEAFICNTGPPFKYDGTTRPLHILKEGAMPIERVLEDEFYLACLTWKKIDDCSRLPISVKIADDRLREIAGEYNIDALRFEEEE